MAADHEVLEDESAPGAVQLVGADGMSRALAVPNYIADVIVAASLISVLVATLLTQYRVRLQ